MVSSGGMVLDCPVHELSVGDKQLLQPSRNWPMHQAKCYSHLKCNLRLKAGARYLLLGKNGCGKTTLMREIAAGRLEGFPEWLSTYLVDQELTLDPAETPLGAVLKADGRLETLQREADALEASNEQPGSGGEEEDGDEESSIERLCSIYEEIDAIGAEDEGVRARRAGVVLQGLGFDEGGMEMEIGSLSGGWKMRVALAAAIFMSPHLLLLDEPTNHLDVQGIRWLQRYLAEDYHGTILCVSHDRSFIDSVATDLIIFAEQALDYYSGTLSEFEDAAQERHRGLQRQVDALEKKKDHIRSSVQNMERAAAGKKATSTSKAKSGDDAKLQQVASRKKKLGRMGLEKTADGRKFNAQKHGIRQGADNNNDGARDPPPMATF